MSLNQWSRRSLVVVAAAFAITGLLIGSSAIQGADEEEVAAVKPAKSLTITITANEDGQMSSLMVGLAKLFTGAPDAGRLRHLDRRLKDVLAIEGVFDQVVLRVDRRLNAGDLIEIIHVCDNQKMADGGPIKKISFVVLGD